MVGESTIGRKYRIPWRTVILLGLVLAFFNGLNFIWRTAFAPTLLVLMPEWVWRVVFGIAMGFVLFWFRPGASGKQLPPRLDNAALAIALLGFAILLANGYSQRGPEPKNVPPEILPIGLSMVFGGLFMFLVFRGQSKRGK